MKRRARAQWFSLFFITLVGVLLRYPRFPNEFAGDTLELHFFTDALRETGTLGFVMNPLSWFGVYPVSYPTGVPIVAATFGSLAGIPSDDALSILGIMCGVVGTLAIFCLAHRLSSSSSAALIAAAAFALSGYHVSQTIAGVSGRAMVMTIFPMVLLVMALSTSGRIVQPKMGWTVLLPAFVVLNITMAASHRLFLLAAATEAVIIACLAGYRWVLPLFPESWRRLLPSGAVLLLLCGALLAIMSLQIKVGSRAGPVFLSEFLNTSNRELFTLGYFIEQGYSIGPLIPLAPIGFLAAVGPRFGWVRMLQGMALAFSALFFIAVPSFTGVVLAPFFCVLIGIGWDRVRAARLVPRTWSARGATAAVAVVLALCLALPGYFIYETQRPYRNPDGTSFFTDQEAVEAGVFLQHEAASGTFITPDLTDARRVMADGHVATVSSETTMFIADPGLRDKITIQYRFERMVLSDPEFYTDALQIFLQTKSLYSASDWIVPGAGYGLGGHWGKVVTLEGSAGRIIEEYGSDHVLLNNNRDAHPLHAFARVHYYAEYSNAIETVYVMQTTNGCLHGLRGCP